MKYFVIVLLYYCCAFDGVVLFEQVQKVTYGRKKRRNFVCIKIKSECNRGDIVAFFDVLFVIFLTCDTC